MITEFTNNMAFFYFLFYAFPYYMYKTNLFSVLPWDCSHIGKAVECTSLHMLFLEGCPWGDICWDAFMGWHSY